MIKKLNLIFVFFLFNFINAQESAFMEIQEDEEIGLKNYIFKAGKPVFVLVSSNDYDLYKPSLFKRERAELRRNFKDLNADYHIIENPSNISFENESDNVFSFTDENTRNLVVYWDGEPDSEVLYWNEIVQATSFFRDQLRMGSVPSYIDRFASLHYQMREKRTWNPSEDSKMLQRKCVNDYILKEVFNLGDWSTFFNTDFKGVKSATITRKSTATEKFILSFNPDGDILSIKEVDEAFGDKIYVFDYKDNLLSKITFKSVQENEYSNTVIQHVYYNGGQLIIHEPLDKTDQDSKYAMYSIKNGLLTYSKIELINKYLAFFPELLSIEENNTIEYSNTISGTQWKFKTFENSQKLAEQTYTSEVLKNEYKDYGFSKIDLIKKSDLEYQIIREDNSIKYNVYYLNKNLISKINFKPEMSHYVDMDNEPIKILVEYKYY